MAFFDLFRGNKVSDGGELGLIVDLPNNNVNSSFVDNNINNISTVFTCVKILSDTISRVPCGIYDNSVKRGKLKDKQHYLYDVLHYNVNPYTTSQTFFSTMEVHRNLRGNAYARIIRNKGTGRVEQLQILNPDTFHSYKIQDNKLYYKFKVGKEDELKAYNSDEILHFRMLTKDGVVGVNPIEALRLNLSTTYQGLKTIENFYKNNAASPKALKSTVGGANQKAMLEALKEFKKEFAGSNNAGKVIPLPPNTEIQDLTLNYADAEFVSTIKFNADQIASLYGIPPHLVGNFEASKFNNVEQLQLNFKINTISAIARMYRQEMEFKLLTSKERAEGKSIEFTLQGLVETDYRTRITGLKDLAMVGVVSPNTIARIEGYETFEGGDQHFIQGAMTPIEQMKNKTK